MQRPNFPSVTEQNMAAFRSLLGPRPFYVGPTGPPPANANPIFVQQQQQQMQMIMAAAAASSSQCCPPTAMQYSFFPNAQSTVSQGGQSGQLQSAVQQQVANRDQQDNGGVYVYDENGGARDDKGAAGTDKALYVYDKNNDGDRQNRDRSGQHQQMSSYNPISSSPGQHKDWRQSETSSASPKAGTYMNPTHGTGQWQSQASIVIPGISQQNWSIPPPFSVPSQQSPQQQKGHLLPSPIVHRHPVQQSPVLSPDLAATLQATLWQQQQANIYPTSGEVGHSASTRPGLLPTQPIGYDSKAIMRADITSTGLLSRPAGDTTSSELAQQLNDEIAAKQQMDAFGRNSESWRTLPDVSHAAEQQSTTITTKAKSSDEWQRGNRVAVGDRDRDRERERYNRGSSSDERSQSPQNITDKDKGSGRGRRERRSARRRSSSDSRSRSRSRSPRYRSSYSSRRRRSTSSEDRDRESSRFRYPRQPPEPHHTIAIKGLPSDVEEDFLYALIEEQGFKPKDIRLLRKKETGQSRGFGFIEFADVSMAKAWMEHTQGSLEVDRRHRAPLQYSVDRVSYQQSNNQKFGDWICAKCTMNNFKKRDYCFKCGLTKDDSDMMQEQGFSQIGVTPCDTLLFRNLPIGCHDRKILRELSKLSALEPLCVHMAPSKIFAYVQMRSINEAAQLLTALTTLTQLLIDNSEVAVSYSKQSLTAVLSVRAADQANRMHSHMISSEPQDPETIAQMKQSQTDAANVAASVAQNALRKAQVMRHVANEVLTTQMESKTDTERTPATLLQNPSAVANMSMVSSTSLALGTVNTPIGELPRYPYPNTANYRYEPKSGYYYDPMTGLYYDGNSRYYYNAETQQWLYWDGNYQTYLPCSGQQTSDTKQQQPVNISESSAEPDSSSSTVGANLEVPKKEQKTDKAESAKKIQREMDKWAREQEKDKKAARAGTGQKRVGAQPFTIKSAAADAAFAVLTRTNANKSKPLPFNNDSDEGEDEMEKLARMADERAAVGKVTANLSSSTTTTTATVSEEENKIVDYSKIACLLCRRQFPNLDVLNKHVQMSELHKQNLADYGLLDQVTSSETASASGNSNLQQQQAVSGGQYRDRAAERRHKYGQDKSLLKDMKPRNDLKERYLNERAANEDLGAALRTVGGGAGELTEDNRGNKLLQSMGWTQGQGLGRLNQGIVNPIEAERRQQGVGLGAAGAKVSGVSNATYRENLKAAHRDRFFEMQ